MSEWPVNSPMIRPLDAPGGWVCNTYLHHYEGGKKSIHYNRQGKIVEETVLCSCLECLRKRDPGLKADNPLQVHEDFPESVLREKGLVGVYRHIEKGKEADGEEEEE